jgi:hypothetical protein
MAQYQGTAIVVIIDGQEDHFTTAAARVKIVNRFHSYKFVTRHGAKHGVVLRH